MFTMLTIYISRLSIVTTQGLSSVLVVCVFFYLCQVISQDAHRWREGQGHQRRCGTPVLSGSSVCEDGSWPCSLITPHPADTPAIHPTPHCLRLAIFLCFGLIFQNPSWLTIAGDWDHLCPGETDYWLRSESSLGHFPPSQSRCDDILFNKGLREMGNGTPVALTLTENLSPLRLPVRNSVKALLGFFGCLHHF